VDDHSSIAKYWDIIQHNYNYAAEANRVIELFADSVIKNVLDVGCGSGSHLVGLAERGFRGVGVDLSDEMVQVALDKARQSGLPLTFCQANLHGLPFPPLFDAVISFYVMSSFLNAVDFGMALQGVRKVLRPGGLFVFNVLNAEFDDAASDSANGHPPYSFMDLGVQQGDVSLMRFNRFAVREQVQDCTYVYLIQDQGHLSLHILHNPMRSFHLTWVEQQLAASGFQRRAVKYVDVGGVKKWDMVISAVAV
jgi:SAM-dependent methyltransferase